MSDLQGFGGMTKPAGNDNQGYCLTTPLQMSNTHVDKHIRQPKALVKGFGDMRVVKSMLAFH